MPRLLQNFVRQCIERYGTIDLRVLALFRIAFGLLLLSDLLRRLPDVSLFYSNEGVLSNHFALYAPIASPNVSLLFAFSTPAEVWVAMGLVGCVYVALTLGVRTRTAQVMALVCFVSVNGRNLFLENRASWEIASIAAWTVFLPLGSRYSVDSLRARVAPGRSTVQSVAVFGAVLQIAAVYGFNALNKTGPTWMSGEAVHYVLWQNRVTTGVGAWIREAEPAWFSPLLSYAAVALEASIALLILSPVRQRDSRFAAYLLAVTLHLGMTVLWNLWPHSYANVVLNLLFLPTSVLDSVVRRVAGLKGWVRVQGWSPGRIPEFVCKGGTEDLLVGPKAKGATVRFARGVREGLALLFLAAMVQRMAHDNAVVPERYRPVLVEWLDEPVKYLRVFQNWSMFGPDAPITDGTVVVDAVMANGQHVDPLTGVAPDFEAPLHGPWFQRQSVCDYFRNIARDENTRYRPELGAYLLGWHEREGRGDEERIVSYEIYWVGNDAPPPGERGARNMSKRLLFKGARRD